MERTPLWLDCDPGHDDAFAILIATQHPRLCLLGISTVYGNAPLSRTTANAASILTAFGSSDVPVYAGSEGPFCYDRVGGVHAEGIHGTSGIDGTTLLPTPLKPPVQNQNAILAARDALLSTKQHTAWVVATGALTNVALLFATFPEVADWVKGLSIMGGAVGGGFTDVELGRVVGESRVGNWTRWAEFNIYCDPESAQSLFSNPILAKKTTLVPLDLTHLVLATQPVLSSLLHGPTPGTPPSTLRQLLHDLLTFFAATYARVFGLTDGPPLHDPIAVIAIIPPSIDDFGFDDRDGERFKVEVVTGPGEQTGRTVVEKALGAEGVRIPRGVDVERFWACVFESVRKAEEVLAQKEAA
ncbi:MAG: Uridine nucleosidase 1 [Trichoglossum hirsutum]|nr:MAG: Uridine nucleosidase 1 [Trichoglossum hirsutum]